MLISSEESRVAGWVCAGVSLVILIARVITARVAYGSFDISTVICAVAIVIISGRIVVNQYVLTYGSSNDAVFGNAEYFDANDLEHLKIGSILILVARLMITTVYWLQICLLLLFYSRILLVRGARSTSFLIRVSWIAVPVTYIAVALATFLECQPFRLYWQVHPDPGKCIRAYVQLLTQGISNIVLDLLVLAISYPLVASMRHRTASENLRMGALYCLGFFCIIVTCLRIGYIFAEQSYQPVRAFWASIQMVVACFVANTPTIYGSLKLMRRRKSVQTARRASRPDVWMSPQVTTATTTENASASDVPVDGQQTTSPTSSEKGRSRWIP